MKHYLTLLLFTCIWGLSAQTIDIGISGTVTDANGDPVEGVTVQIFTDSLPSNVIYFNTVATDAQGQYSDSFSVPDNLTQGALFAAMEDCNGYYVTEVAYWSPASTALTIDFTYCDVQNFCEVFIAPTAIGELEAVPTGTAPFSYQWSSGETTAIIAPNAPGTYCVTVTDANGCTVSSCYDVGNPIDTLCSVYISLEGNTGAGLLVEAVPSGEPPYTYAWSTGETTSSIVIPVSGVYCVTVTDSEGCIAEACADANVLPCDVAIQVDSSGLTAIPDGDAPFTFSWSDGSTAASITPAAAGQYCVTVTDAGGCQASACYYWNTAIDTSCYVYILPVQGGTMLEAVADGAAPFAYSWSTGGDTPLVPVNAAGGDYCVTITDANGCQSSACYTIAPAENYNIQGYVFLADSSVMQPIEGEVFLIQYDPSAGTLTAVDTVPLSSTPFGAGGYDFGDVPAGDYLIKAALSPSSFGYEDNLPTYYGNTLWWDEATTVSVPFSGNAYFDIILVEGDNPGGPGFIGGLVTDGANLSAAPGQVQNRAGEPLVGVSLILLDEFDQPVAYTYTDENGEFEFPSLAWGTFKAVLEIPGHEQAYYMVTLGPDNPEVHGLIFEVTETGILNVRAAELGATLILYPIPADEQLTVSWESQSRGEALLFITDFSGRILYREPIQVREGMQQFSLNIGQLPSGLYTLGISAGKGAVGKKFVKE
ncbi:MAG: carboxypeptidase regulatory-like domain-containing protein [Lewinellaceae bacterium]|nr:carboxypeptidase regulatory-like domain-containing protein [Lewinellaceae bacterium]